MCTTRSHESCRFSDTHQVVKKKKNPHCRGFHTPLITPKIPRILPDSQSREIWVGESRVRINLLTNFFNKFLLHASDRACTFFSYFIVVFLVLNIAMWTRDILLIKVLGFSHFLYDFERTKKTICDYALACLLACRRSCFHARKNQLSGVGGLTIIIKPKNGSHWRDPLLTLPSQTTSWV